MVRGGRSEPSPPDPRGCGEVRSGWSREAVERSRDTGGGGDEAKGGDQGKADQQSTHRTQSRARVTQALDRVRQTAERRFGVTPPR